MSRRFLSTNLASCGSSLRALPSRGFNRWFCVQVDLTLAGHDHKYERTCPVYKRTCLQARPVLPTPGLFRLLHAALILNLLCKTNVPHGYFAAPLPRVTVPCNEQRSTSSQSAFDALVLRKCSAGCSSHITLQRGLQAQHAAHRDRGMSWARSNSSTTLFRRQEHKPMAVSDVRLLRNNRIGTGLRAGRRMW